MYMFNRNKRPHLIITESELLFRDKPDDADMRRHHFSTIEKVSLVRQDSEDEHDTIHLEVQIKGAGAPVLLELSSLDEPLNEMLSLLEESLENKVSFSLRTKTKPKKGSTRRTGYLVGLFALLAFLGSLLSLHKLSVPTLDDLEKGVLKADYEQGDALCSAAAKAAYEEERNDFVTIEHFCGLLGFWYQVSQQSIEKRHLETEFSPLLYSDYISKANQQIEKGEYSSAITSLEKAIYRNPDSEEAYLLLAHNHRQAGNEAFALQAYHNLLILNPDSFKAHYAIAHLYLDEQDYKKAYTHLQTAVLLQPGSQVYIDLAQTALLLGERLKALTYYEQALLKDNQNLLLLNKLGLLYWEQHAYDKAAKVFEKAYTSAPDDPKNLLNYYEISLITPTSLDQDDKKDFSKRFSNESTVLMVYDMLAIIERAIEQKEVLTALKAWDNTYSGMKLNWSLTQLRSWIDKSHLDEDERYNVRKIIGFFIAYQQIYNLEHTIIPTGEDI